MTWGPEAVYERVHAVLSELPSIPKGGTAPAKMGGYSFRRLEDITAALGPLLADHGVFITPTVIDRRDSVRTTSGGGSLYVADLLVRFAFYSVVGNDVLVCDVWGCGSDSGDKATQKAISAAFKSMLLVTFCISEGNDDAESHDVPETYEQPAPEGFHSMEEALEIVRPLRDRVAALGLGGWVKDHEFGWPWSRAACVVITARCNEREEIRALAAPFEGSGSEDGVPGSAPVDRSRPLWQDNTPDEDVDRAERVETVGDRL